MTKVEQAGATAANPIAIRDRYVSFIGLDCDAKAAALVGGLCAAMTAPGRADPFWDYFAAKVDGRRGPRHDALYLIHCHLNDLRDLADRWGLAHMIELIDHLEVECC
jgi:hypothetical protein